MNALVICDSVFGNTEKIARSITGEQGPLKGGKLERAANWAGRLIKR
jgi:hypothetical protein